MPIDQIVGLLVNGSPPVVLILMIAVIFLWRELKRERKGHLEALQGQVQAKEEYVRMTEQLKAALEGFSDVARNLQPRRSR